MALNVKITLNPAQQILQKRGLNRGGRVQQYFGGEIARLSDPYVPFRNGPLKNTVQVLKQGAELLYPQPYAARQWNSTRPPGRKTGPLRGPKWCFRMWAARGKEIKQGVAGMAGGRAE